MINDYKCPKCHNVFPSQNKIMHDARCTVENPMPLDLSRQMKPNNDIDQPIVDNKNNSNIRNNEEKPPEIKKNYIQSKPQAEHQIQPQPEPLKKMSESGEFPSIFVCEICGETLPESEKSDHMFCHNLEKQEKERINNRNNFQVSQRQIEQQRQIENLIKQQNEMRRQSQNQQNQRPTENQRESNRNQNNLFDNDMQILRNMGIGGYNIPEFTQTTIRNDNTQNNPNRVNMRIIRRGPDGQVIYSQFSSNNRENLGDMDPFMMFGSSGNNRMMIPFSNFSNFGNMNSLFQQILQNLGRHEHPTDQQILNELPETKIEDVTKLDAEKKNCIICLEDFKNGDKATVLPCIHLFHTECIKNWLKTQNSCPICKFKLTGENINSQQP